MKILLIPATGRNGFKNYFHVSNSFCFFLLPSNFVFLCLHKCKAIAWFERCRNTTLSDPSINKNIQIWVSSKQRVSWSLLPRTSFTSERSQPSKASLKGWLFFCIFLKALAPFQCFAFNGNSEIIFCLTLFSQIG